MRLLRFEGDPEHTLLSGGAKLKKWVVILSLVILATITYSTWSAESDFYVKAVTIHKVYHHQKGFVVLYEKQNLDLHRVFIPYDWFNIPQEQDGRWKAEVFYGEKPEYPYMNIYWDRQGFSHLRLYLKTKKTDPSWGSLKNPNSYDNSFDIESPDFSF